MAGACLEQVPAKNNHIKQLAFLKAARKRRYAA